MVKSVIWHLNGENKQLPSSKCYTSDSGVMVTGFWSQPNRIEAAKLGAPDVYREGHGCGLGGGPEGGDGELCAVLCVLTRQEDSGSRRS